MQENKSAAVSQLKRLVADFSPWRSQIVTMAPHVRFVMYNGTETGFVSEHLVSPATAHFTNFPYSFIIRGMDPGRNSNRKSHPNHKNMKQKEKRLNACFYTAKNRLISFCRANPTVCKIIILCDNYRQSLPAATPPHVWAVG